MLKRIAVVGGKDATVPEELLKAAKGKDVELVKVASKAKIPPAVVVAVADDAKASLTVSIADVLASRQEDMLYLLATAIDSREELAPGSSLRVKEHATRFAKALKLSPKDQATLERGALLRDIGKLRIPNRILLKYDLLTHDEWETIYRHSATGAEVVRETPVIADIEDIVHYHHERWDGNGYPNGLEGDDTPLLAQAVHILDVYCAMTSIRHYRKEVHGHDAVLDYLQSESGAHFHPELLKVFIDAGVGQT